MVHFEYARFVVHQLHHHKDGKQQSMYLVWNGRWKASERPQRAGLREHGSQGPDAIRTLSLLISVYRSASLCVPVEVQGLKPYRKAK